ncbi:GPALPP motifs-containing protein 1 isoform X1 [Schistocerca americana]|uniref:GPALPP motifs-containing protein 1 isoform X1 n=1 Tax=Schistocerca americana TaxID=7009 RepID=UPI001F500703|nr:GPALPP motifs-containing protein 1 isoform X1 [Schistocerca americana]
MGIKHFITEAVNKEGWTLRQRNMSNFIGPALPPHLKISRKNSDDKNECNDDDVVTGDVSDEEYREDAPSEQPAVSEDMYGPALPPGFKPRVVGPAAMVTISMAEQSSTLPDSINKSSDDEDGDVVGPMPASDISAEVTQQLQQQLESRAHRMKEKLSGKEEDQKLKRETWMLELPPEKANQFGLGPRQFRARAAPNTGDRSVWTDTPEDRERKASHQPVAPTDSLKQKALKQRDQEIEKLTEGYSKKRQKESLLESHQKKLKSEKKKNSDSKQERRPFDRNVDLQANRFDEAQKKAIFKKAQLLNDRFASGESKYL